MAFHRVRFDGLKGTGRAVVAACLSGLMVGQPMPAQAPVERKLTQPAGKQIQGDERVLHALNRLTFGPRPGEVAAVNAVGLNQWFKQQLNPAGIDDSALDARLAQYPAMDLSIADIEKRYPGPQMIRQIINGKVSLPRDTTERALTEDQIALYKMQKAKQESKAPDAVGGGETLNAAKPAVDGEMAADMTDAATPADRAARHEQLLKLASMQADQRFQAILALSPDQLVGIRQGFQGPMQGQIFAGMTPQQKETLLALGGSLKMVGLESMESRMERDMYSNRQLEAVMTDFWLNHFNVYVRKNQQEAFLIPTYERDTIRPRALGSFEDLLLATAMSPAMLEYLDNARSIGPNSRASEREKQKQFLHPNAKGGASEGLNENYGRELMELHTLGVNGGYTQADVTNVAKVFTGWTIDPETQKFVFNENRHEPGKKVVLGQTIKEDGYHEALEVIHMLATSPATAHFISQKLAVRFVSDDPPPALVERMAATFLESHGSIKNVLITMWNSPEFWSPAVYRAKVKTPEEFVVSAVRASGAEVTQPAALVQALNKLGMPLYGMQTPQGYGWKQDDWVSTGALVSRMNFSLVLSGDRIPGVQTNWTAVAEGQKPGLVPTGYSGDDAAAAKERKLEAVLIGQPVSERTRAAVMGQANDRSVTEQAETQFDLRGGGKGRVRGIGTTQQGAQDDPQAAVMAGLLLGSPEFQRR